jgi:hypothetical protein
VIRINLLRPKIGASFETRPAPAASSGALVSRRGVWLAAILLVLGGVALFHLASHRTVRIPPQPGPVAERYNETPGRPAAAPAQLNPSSAEAAKAVQPDAGETDRGKAPQPPPEEFQVSGISIHRRQQEVVILVRAQPGLKYRTTELQSPDRIVIDLPNCRLAVPASQLSQQVHEGEVKALRMSQFQLEPPVTRIVLDVVSLPRYQISPSEEGIEIRVPGGRR